MRFSSSDVERFAAWSHDRNPLHVDPAFARDTPFGQAIAHGMLSVLEACASVSGGLPMRPTGLDIEFRGAIVPDVAYQVEDRPGSDERIVTVRGGDATLVHIRLPHESAAVLDIDDDASWAGALVSGARTPDAGPRSSAAVRAVSEFDRGVEIVGTYSVNADERFEGAGLDPTCARVLGLCSYIVGMELPGHRSLFTRLTVRFGNTGQSDAPAAASPALWYRARTLRFDRHFRLLDTRLDITRPDGGHVATALLRSYVPFGQIVTSLDDLSATISGSERLQGRVALVCGGTRGLGSDVAAALALSGCHVYVGARGRTASFDELCRRLDERDRGLVFLPGDVGDAAFSDTALARIRTEQGRLDILVLNACAPPRAMRMGPDTAVRHDAYVRENLRLVQTPLVACLDALESSAGTVVYVSSSFVDDMPPGFGHYVALKQAGEAFVRAAQHERTGVAAVIARPPRLQTSWNDTPAGAAGAIPPAQAAVQIVSRLGTGAGSGQLSVVSEFPSIRPAASTPPASQSGRVFPVRVLSTFTLDPLLPGLKYWLRELDAGEHVELGPYGQVLQGLLDPASSFAARGGLNVVLVRTRDWLRELPTEQADSIEFLRGYLDGVKRDLEGAVRAHRARAASDTLLIFCPSSGASSAAESIVLRQVEDDLIAALAGVPGLQIASAADYHSAYGVDDDAIDDAFRDELAHIPYRDTYYHTLATIIARHAYRQLAPRRKVVVVDCDNTLWKGVVGEAGSAGLTFEAAHAALHQKLNRLIASGVLVCLCSKNEDADVWSVFETRTELTLRRDDVVAAAINWQPKSENLRALAARLNLGLDSFVFIDDNPIECAEVRARCPEVLTLQWPTEDARAVSLLQHTWELDVVAATSEDQRRTQMYREEFRRQELRTDTLTFADFIKDLDLHVEIAPIADDDLKRASQLTLRTNQFNFTTRRRDESELHALVAGARHEVRTVRVRDRFGDYGLVGLVIAELQDEAVSADTFLLSCRVLGRGVEHQMAAACGQIALERGVAMVRMRVETTKRNTPALKFLESIAAAGASTAHPDVLECEFGAAALAAIQFVPVDVPSYVPADVEGSSAAALSSPMAHAAPAGESLRRREAQIERTAFEFLDPAALAAAIAGERGADHDRLIAPPAADSAASVDEIKSAVSRAFSRALRVPVETVERVDRLEALGCDSLKIVEITVALLESYPWLPSTLLFEHRSVSHIVREIARLGGHDRKPAVAPAPAGPSEPATGRSVDVAVVGMHLRCAGANSPSELWRLLSEGRSAVASVPANRRHFLHPLVDSRLHWAGLLDDVGGFDAEFFGISPREAELMDPQLRLFLEVAWNAIEDAGCAGQEHDQDTGVFVGVMYGDYGYRANAGARRDGPYRCWEGFSLANRLSQILGYRGPSLAVDTACSSSGTALHVACQALNAGDCRVAIVGGVNLILDPDRFASLGRLGILSPRGVCEPFGADADGTVLGEGAGVVVLRPLDEALRRGDRICGVIKGTGVSTGSGTVGFTAPNPQAQAEAIARSLRLANVDPRTITYVESHGTGTVLGDPIEVRGLTLAYGADEALDTSLAVRHRCTIGSLKPNIGHLEAGAGVLGLIKVLLQFQHGMKLPSLTSAEPNPHIPFGDTAFDVQRQLEPWDRLVVERNGSTAVIPRRAGLNSFGVGGANAHIVVEEVMQAEPDASPVERPLHLWTASARTDEALQGYVARMRDALEADPGAPVADLSYSANVGRRSLDHRIAVVAGDRSELAGSLKQIAEGTTSPRIARGLVQAENGPAIGFLFTGQGSQYAGMGHRFYETQPVFRDALDRCASIFDRVNESHGRDRVGLLQVLFAREGSEAAEWLHQTGYTQPALFALEYALAELWRSWGVTPSVVMGHSVGEIAAMCVAGGVSLADGVKLIAARGRLMQALPSGGSMTSVMAAEPRVLAAIAGAEDHVAIAAINAPTQVVISGTGVAVAEITARLEAEGIRTKPLTVSHAFHSPLMKPMLAEYEAVVREIHFARPNLPFVSCVDGRVLTDEVTRPEYWVRQVLDPVRFTTGMQAVAQQVGAFVEIGPHPVLLGMGRQCMAEREDAYQWLPSLHKGADPWQTILTSLAALYVHGTAIDWRGCDAPYTRRRSSVPAYAFKSKQYWLRDDNRAPSGGRVVPAPDVGLYQIAWQKQIPTVRAPDAAAGNWVVLADARGIGVALARQLSESGGSVTLVSRGSAFERVDEYHYVVNARDAEDLGRLWSAVAGGSSAPAVVHLWGLDTHAARDATELVDYTETVAIGSVVHLVRLMAAYASRPKLWVVTEDAVFVDDASTMSHRTSPLASAAQASLWGLGRSVALEHPQTWGGLIDVGADERFDVKAVTDELLGGSDEDQLAFRGRDRYVARLTHAAPTRPAPLSLDPNGTYLVTGGLGAIGVEMSRWLVSKGARRLVLVSRRGTRSDSSERVIRTLEGMGAAVRVDAADVSTRSDVARLLNDIAGDGAPLRGIVHAAGTDKPASLGELSPRELGDVLAPKVAGAAWLHELTSGLKLDVFICCSSIASILGAHSRAHYSAANAFLDALMAARHRQGLRSVAVNWGPWAGGGMATEELLRQFARIGNYGLAPTEAMQAFDRVLQSDTPQMAIARIDWGVFRSAYEVARPRPVVSGLSTVMANEPVSETVAQSASNQPARGEWATQLGSVEAGHRAPLLEALLRAEVAGTLGFERPEDVPLDKSFYQLGMDSLMTAELVGKLRKRIGSSCTALVFDHPNVNALVPRLLEVLQPSFDAPIAEDPQSPASLSPASTGIEGYSSGIDEEVAAFQRDAWPNRRPETIASRWEWMFVDSANRLGVDPQVWLYRDDGRIVGHMGAIPVKLWIGSEERTSAWLVDTMVLESHRNGTIGSRLMLAAREDVPFALSLGQTAEMRQILLRLGWVQVAPLQTAQLLIRPERVLAEKLPGAAAWAAGTGLRAIALARDVLRGRTQWKAREVSRFDDRHDALWSAMSRDVACAVVRDSSFLNWKHVAQPGQSFLKLEIVDGAELKAVAVLSFAEPNASYRYGRAHLIDIVAPLADDGLVRQVVQVVSNVAAEQGADALSCLHVNRALTRALESSGFMLRQPNRFLLVQPEGLTPELRARVLNEGNWLVTQSDSDIDRPGQ